MNNEAEPVSQCQNCDMYFHDEDLEEIKDLFQRVAPGEPMPTGQCRECGALCQRVEGEVLTSDFKYISAARRLHEEEGEVEIDEGPGRYGSHCPDQWPMRSPDSATH